MELKVYRNRSVVETLPIDNQTKLTQQFYGGNVIKAVVSSRRVLSIAIGDYVVHNAIRYYVNTLPDVVKEATNSFRYTITFEAEYYDLAKVQFLNLDGESDFNYMATAVNLIDLIVMNMNRVYGADVWTKGTCDHSNTDTLCLHFEGENCREVIQRICREFTCEVMFSRKEISLTDRTGVDTGLIFQYKAGLRGITRTSASDKNIVTRLYAFGADRNLGDGYGSIRLRPPVTKNLLTNPGFETGDFTGWSQWGTPVTRSVIDFYNPKTMPDGSPVPIGSKAYHHAGNGQNQGSSQTVTVKPNTAYTVSCYVYALSKTSIRLLTQANGAYSYQYPVGLNAWERLSVTVTTGAETSLTVWLGGEGECYFDAVQVERRDVLTGYVSGPARYLEKNTAEYGTVEHTVMFDDIYPTRTGTISSVDGSNSLIFYDTGMDFDLNSYLMSGVTAKVNFLTGSLAGYTFEVESYVHASKKFTIIEYDVRNGDSLPNASLKPAPGDTYVLVDITLPASYVAAAEEKLLDRAETYINENSSPRVTYDLKPDPRYLRQHNILLTIGDRMTISDSDLDTSVVVRIVELERSLLNPYDVEIKLSDTIQSSIIQRLYDTGADLRNRTQIDRTGDIIRSGLNRITASELRNIIVAPDGYIRIGLLTADNIITGKLESSDGSTYFDLDNNRLVIGSATGYAAITDRPTSLAAINATEGSKLSGIEAGADVTGSHIAAGISGQGSLATRNNVDWATHIASIPARLNAGDTPTATGVYITPNYIGFYNQSTTSWPVRIKNNAGTGEFYVGNGVKYVSWNGSTLTIRGSLNADDITAGTLKGITVQVFDGSNNGIQLDGANNNLSMWDSSNMVALLDKGMSGVANKTLLHLASSDGGQFVAAKKASADGSYSHYAMMDDGHISVVNNEADSTAVIMAKRTANDVTALFLADYRGTGNGMFFQGQDASNTHVMIYRYNNAGRILLGDAGTTDIQIGKSATTLGDGVWARDGFECLLGVAINEFSTDGTLGGNSDDALPTEKAVKTYVGSAITAAINAHIAAFH